MLMILPLPRGIMCLATALPTLNTPVTLVCSSFCHWSSGKSSSGERNWTPALLIRMSIAPMSASIRSMAGATDAGSTTSNTEAWTVWPSERSVSAARSSFSCVAAIENDGCAVLGEAARQAKADALARAGDQSPPSGEAEEVLHGFS